MAHRFFLEQAKVKAKVLRLEYVTVKKEGNPSFSRATDWGECVWWQCVHMSQLKSTEYCHLLLWFYNILFYLKLKSLRFKSCELRIWYQTRLLIMWLIRIFSHFNVKLYQSIKKKYKIFYISKHQRSFYLKTIIGTFYLDFFKQK